MNQTERRAILSAILAAALFGSVAPVAKTLLSAAGPVTLAGLFYLGAGIGLIIIKILFPASSSKEAPITRDDLPWLILLTLAGGIAGPILLMYGLELIPAGTASLLLNGELVMTALIAAFFFHEPLERRSLLAIGIILAGSLLLSYDPLNAWGISPAAVLIILACLCWGIDNNATRQISGKDPVTLVIIKGVVAGFISVWIAFTIQEPWPGIEVITMALIVGLAGYGSSLLLFIRSLRVLGAARTGTLFATAPFIGVGTSFLILGEIPNIIAFLAMPLMIIGVWMIASEWHEHPHRHQADIHNHRHSHDDDHHTHTHNHQAEPEKEHAHIHQHEHFSHIHAHTPDLHHCHTHEESSESKESEYSEIREHYERKEGKPN